MANYIGAECFSCKDTFKLNDDIVVCPDCGTPYHRGCYELSGECTNNELHETNGSWVNNRKTLDTLDEIKCSNCGMSNVSTGLFCTSCGSQLTNPNDSQGNASENMGRSIPPFIGSPFGQPLLRFDANSDLGGVTVKELKEYVGPSSMYFLPHFIKFSKFNGKISINIMSMLFPQFYFFYRKMNIMGIFAFILQTIALVGSLFALSENPIFAGTFIESFQYTNFSESSINTILSLTSILNYANMFFFGGLGNYFYYKKAVKDIKKIKSENVIENLIPEIIKNKGGTSRKAAMLSIFIPYVVFMFLIFLI